MNTKEIDKSSLVKAHKLFDIQEISLTLKSVP